MKTFGIIPARGGSKGVLRKNIKEFCGRPLIYWSIKAAKESSLLDYFVVSTDDEEIANIAGSFGAEVHKRDADLATDEATTISLVNSIAQDAASDFDSFLILQPTSPIRPKNLIDECIRDFKTGDFDCLATGYYNKALEYGSHNNLRRQDYKGFFYDDGSVYIVSRDLAIANQWTGNSICRKIQERQFSFEIDDHLDWIILESIQKSYTELT